MAVAGLARRRRAPRGPAARPLEVADCLAAAPTPASVRAEYSRKQRLGHLDGRDLPRGDLEPPFVSAWRRRAAPAGGQAFQLVQHLVESQPRDELHDVVVQPVLFADAEDRDDVGVVQPGGRLRLALEPLLLPGIAEELPRQHLEGHVSAERDLLGLVDDAHAAAADFAQDAVIAETFRVLDRPPAQGRGRSGQRARLAVGGDLLHHDQRGEQIADLVGVLRVAGDEFGERRPLAPAVALDELLGQLFHRLPFRPVRFHDTRLQGRRDGKAPHAQVSNSPGMC